MYQHRNWQGDLLNLPVGKVVCVAKNYADHVKNLGDDLPKEPLLFMKPESALCDILQPIMIPSGLGRVHHEIELAILIGSTLKQASQANVADAFAGFGVALDLTLRDVRESLKQCDGPWEKSKAFDGACPISGFIPVKEFSDPQQAELTLMINGDIRQQGSTCLMLTPIVPLVAYMSQFFTLRPGDIILTGTPKGVGPLMHGDQLVISLNDNQITTHIL